MNTSTTYNLYYWTPKCEMKVEEYTSRSSAIMRAEEFKSANRSVRAEKRVNGVFTESIFQFVAE